MIIITVVENVFDDCTFCKAINSPITITYLHIFHYNPIVFLIYSNLIVFSLQFYFNCDCNLKLNFYCFLFLAPCSLLLVACL